MPKSPKVVLTGGGTAGHVMPHFALIEEFKSRQWDFYYIGSKGIERELVEAAGVPFKTIKAGKLRRYFSIQNFLDIFKIIFGFFQSLGILAFSRPHVVFSKGGFVSVPVCLAARCLGIKVVTHESDLTPGLATKIIARIATDILCTFPETTKYIGKKSRYVGAIVRPEILQGQKSVGLEFCGFSENNSLSVLLVMGGSLGALRINECLNLALPELVKTFRVIHLTGKAKEIGFAHENYRAFDFVGDEMKHLLAATDYVVSRAGANSIFEFLSLTIPMLLIPLEIGSRGDQVHNAESFVRNGWASVLREEDLSRQTLLTSIQELKSGAAKIKEVQAGFHSANSIDQVMSYLNP